MCTPTSRMMNLRKTFETCRPYRNRKLPEKEQIYNYDYNFLCYLFLIRLGRFKVR